MIKRFYINNFRCLQNFELPISELHSAVLIGKNGSGKTSVGRALEILQKIARGTNRVRDLLGQKDFPRWQSDVPMRFELSVELKGRIFGYVVVFDFPKAFKELRVTEESLTIDGKTIFQRELAKVQILRTTSAVEATFSLDWHLVALPIVQGQSGDDPSLIFKEWLARVLILRPWPSRIEGESQDETLQPNVEVTNFGSWFSGLIGFAPSAYSRIDEYLKQVMPDLIDIKNPMSGRDSRSLMVQFGSHENTINLDFEELSDGEKCFMIIALVIASNHAYGPLFCFWDEPENYLAPSEVASSVIALRSAFQGRGQIIVTSHNPESIFRFSDNNTFVLYRNSHLEPTILRKLDELRESKSLKGNLYDALITGDV
jgi:ABC-type cobalamin/Fe3+-siderophores transport system ATPase subunit